MCSSHGWSLRETLSCIIQSFILCCPRVETPPVLIKHTSMYMYHVQRNPNHSKGEKLTDSDPSQNDSAWSRLVLPGHEPDTIGPTEPVGLYEYFVLRSNTLSVYSWCTIITDRLAGKGEKIFRLANMRDPLAPGVPVVSLTASHMTVQGTETAYIYIVLRSVVSSSIVHCQYIIT